MKHYLSLSFLLAVLHLSQAGPLRLQKRAAFYIANETACVVDNIVYSSGDPIPTDDPCESCKCRPPGFACVLKECKTKPGCRAVRHAGQCCPEYVCGCEHNGRMYRDGEEIRDEKNPCYECHCQGSSIACAFVDCFFRVDCVPVYVPGKCCPSYRNCARDEPERTSFIGDNALPPVNLLPGLYDESVLTGNFPSTRVPETIKETTDPTQPSTEEDKSSAPEVNESSEGVSNKFLSSELEVPVIEKVKSSDSEIEEKNIEEHNEEVKSSDSEIEEKNTGKHNEEVKPSNSEIEEKNTEKHNEEIKPSDSEIEEKNTEQNEEKVPSEEEKDNTQNEESTTKKKIVEETKVLLNSETEIKIENNEDITTEEKVTEEDKSTIENKVSTEAVPEVKVNSQTTTVNDIETVKDEEATEKFIEVITSTVNPVTEKIVKNSAAENSKSLKLTENETSITTEEKPSKVESDDTKPTDLTENEPEKTAAEESIENPQSTSLNVGNDKIIRKESAETVTIVVHVREKTKPTTETDVLEEQVTTEFSTSEQTSEILLQSNSDLKNTHIEPIVEKSESTGINFEVFPSSIEVSKESSTSSAEQPEEKITEKSETDSIKSDVKEIIKSTLKPDFDASTTQSFNEDLGEVGKEARTDKIVEEIKDDIEVAEFVSGEFNPENIKGEVKVTENSDEIKVTEKTDDLKVTEDIKVPKIEVEHPNLALKIEIAPNSEEQTPKTEEISTEPQEETTEESKWNEEIEEVKSEEKPKLKSEEILTEANEKEQIEESKSESEVEEVQPTEKVEELKSESEVEEVQPTEKVDESKSESEVEKVQPTEKVEESKPEEKTEESKAEETIAETLEPGEKNEHTQPEENKK